MQENDYNAAKEENKSNHGERGKYILYLAALLIFAAILIYASNKWTLNQPIKSISVQGNSIVSDTEITGEIKKPVLNSVNDSISIEEIYEEVKDHPFISSSYVTHDSPRGINIQIQERKPAAILVHQDGSLAYVDMNGTVLPYRLLPEGQDMPLLRNISEPLEKDSSSLKNALQILTNLLNEEYNSLYLTTSEIIYNPESKTYSMISTENGVRIILGRIDNLEKKLANLRNFWSSVIPYENTAGIKYIDLRWANQVVVSKL